jgi:hypothetical protein
VLDEEDSEDELTSSTIITPDSGRISITLEDEDSTSEEELGATRIPAIASEDEETTSIPAIGSEDDDSATEDELPFATASEVSVPKSHPEKEMTEARPNAAARHVLDLESEG